MEDHVELAADGEGVAIIGQPSAVRRFLDATGLTSASEDIGSSRLGSILRAGAGAAQAGSEAAAVSGRWLKLTAESARTIDEFGLTPTTTPGVRWAMAGERGAINSWLKTEEPSAWSLTNPATLAGLAGVMAQVARQHETKELKAYLVRIDHKLEDVLRAQKDAEVKGLLGAGFDIEAAMAVRQRTGRVDDVTWSTVQARTQTITDALAWALLRLDALVDGLARTTKVKGLAAAATRAESEVQDLLAIIARCFELQGGLDVLRLDRTREAHPDDLDGLRLALESDRQRRRDRVAAETERLVARVDEAAGVADLKVLLHRRASPSVVRSSNRVGATVHDFHRPLGIEAARRELAPTSWMDAAQDPQQLRNAATEATPTILAGLAIAGTALVGPRVAAKLTANGRPG